MYIFDDSVCSEWTRYVLQWCQQAKKYVLPNTKYTENTISMRGHIVMKGLTNTFICVDISPAVT